jgi:hypothetical protein
VGRDLPFTIGIANHPIRKPVVNEPTEKVHVTVLPDQVSGVDPKQRKMKSLAQSILFAIPLFLLLGSVGLAIELDGEERLQIFICNDEVKFRL